MLDVASTELAIEAAEPKDLEGMIFPFCQPHW